MVDLEGGIARLVGQVCAEEVMKAVYRCCASFWMDDMTYPHNELTRAICLALYGWRLP